MADLLTRQVTECSDFQPDCSYSIRHLAVGHAEPLRVQLAHFLQAVRTRSRPSVTGEEAVANLRVADLCLIQSPVPVRAKVVDFAAAKPRR
jgi:hypothetical protein